jgi:hypothetical protein
MSWQVWRDSLAWNRNSIRAFAVGDATAVCLAAWADQSQSQSWNYRVVLILPMARTI